MIHAVGYIHQNHIIHRDLKPANVFLHNQGGQLRIKVGDFGISKQLNQTLGLAKTMACTPIYGAPEIHRGSAYNNLVDMWALGCIIHEMCILDRTFDANNDLELLLNIMIGRRYEIPKCYSSDLD